MKRRLFLSLSALSALPVSAAEGAVEEKPPLEEWRKTVSSESLKFRAKSVGGELVLSVELLKPPEKEVTEVIDEKGECRSYRYKGKVLPPRFWQGQSLLTRFDLTWDGQAIKIPERFWSDLAGLDIETSTLDNTRVDPTFGWQAKEFLESLRQPRVTLSAEGGTALIEWVRPEECDSRSTLRWIVSKSGTVLRHRNEPPHDC
jgi:hypothetical protein